MTLLTNITILVLILAVITMTMYYTRRLRQNKKEIQAREREIAALGDKIMAMNRAGHGTSTTPKKTRKTRTTQ